MKNTGFLILPYEQKYIVTCGIGKAETILFTADTYYECWLFRQNYDNV